jgi:hypothetical protein
VYDPVGKTLATVDTDTPYGDDRMALTTSLGDRWTAVDEGWTTKQPLASSDEMSSTIHNPYYCHCQNSIL